MSEHDGKDQGYNVLEVVFCCRDRDYSSGGKSTVKLNVELLGKDRAEDGQAECLALQI